MSSSLVPNESIEWSDRRISSWGNFVSLFVFTVLGVFFHFKGGFVLLKVDFTGGRYFSPVDLRFCLDFWVNVTFSFLLCNGGFETLDCEAFDVQFGLVEVCKFSLVAFDSVMHCVLGIQSVFLLYGMFSYSG